MKEGKVFLSCTKSNCWKSKGKKELVCCHLNLNLLIWSRFVSRSQDDLSLLGKQKNMNNLTVPFKPEENIFAKGGLKAASVSTEILNKIGSQPRPLTAGFDPASYRASFDRHTPHFKWISEFLQFHLLYFLNALLFNLHGNIHAKMVIIFVDSFLFLAGFITVRFFKNQSTRPSYMGLLSNLKSHDIVKDPFQFYSFFSSDYPLLFSYQLMQKYCTVDHKCKIWKKTTYSTVRKSNQCIFSSEKNIWDHIIAIETSSARASPFHRTFTCLSWEWDSRRLSFYTCDPIELSRDWA